MQRTPLNPLLQVTLDDMGFPHDHDHSHGHSSSESDDDHGHTHDSSDSDHGHSHGRRLASASAETTAKYTFTGEEGSGLSPWLMHENAR